MGRAVYVEPVGNLTIRIDPKRSFSNAGTGSGASVPTLGWGMPNTSRLTLRGFLL